MRNISSPEPDRRAYDRPYLTKQLAQWRDKMGRISLFAASSLLIGSSHQNAFAASSVYQQNNGGLRVESKFQAWWRVSGKNRFRAAAVTPAGGAEECPGKQIPAGTYTEASPYTHSDDTTGSTNSVNYAYCYFCGGYYSTAAEGPDHVYSFRVSAIGPNPRIEIIPANPSGYKPLAYVTGEYPGYGGCPAEQSVYDAFDIDNARLHGSDSTANVYASDMRRGGRTMVYVDSELNDSIGAGAYTLKLVDVTVAPAVFGVPTMDVDGDGKSDPTVFRPSDSTWYLNGSSQGTAAAKFGISSDVLAPGDYDGDGKTDIAVFRDGTWWWLNSGDSSIGVLNFGASYAIPVPGDYDGDGRDEITVLQNGSWWSLNLANGQHGAVAPFDYGSWEDIPVSGDFDGDGKADQAVFTTWYWDGNSGYPVWRINRSSQGPIYLRWGLDTDRPVPGDYDGDGKTDVAVFRPSNGTWYILRSTLGPAFFPFGLSTDQLVPADYDGDGKTDPAVFRNGIWYQLRSTGGIAYVPWGLPGDMPLQSAFPQ